MNWIELDSEGAKYFSEGLKKNWVRRATCIHTITFHSRLQTLTSLDISSNEIGGDGAQYLADALKVNRVK